MCYVKEMVQSQEYVPDRRIQLEIKKAEWKLISRDGL
jgi:hypothetical protein